MIGSATGPVGRWISPAGRCVTVLAVAVASIGLVEIAAAPAMATNFGSTACSDPAGSVGRSCVSVANNRTHVGNYVNLGEATQSIPGLATAMTAALADLNGTDMVAYRDEADSLPDVWVQDWNYGALGGIVAWTECPTDNTGEAGTNPNRWCRGQRLKFNVHYWVADNGFYDTAAQRQNVACHELGHSVGLRHRSETRASCMWTFAGDGGDNNYDGHDRAHINGHY